MNLSGIDISIIIVYITAMIAAGVWFSKKAGQNLDSYFLGGKSLPWYLLSVSNASGMFDITGTMWLVYLLFVYGVKSAFIPWLWPSFNQIFLMIFLAAWLRRSNVLTGAEWIKTRFGDGPGAVLSHISVVIFALISVVGFLCYAFKGMGKFAEVFLPWDLSPNVYALIVMGITTIYVVLGGMYSVVLTDVIQFILLTVASIFIAVIAISKSSAVDIAEYIPQGWDKLSFEWSSVNLDWSGLLEAVNGKIESDGYSMFGLFLMMCLFKGFLSSMAGPAPNYDMQRVLATKTPKEASLMSGLVTVILFLPRYLMIAGITVLALIFFRPEMLEMGSDIDFEQILPYVMSNFIPKGLLGVTIAGLLAAFMSTFDSTVNAGSAYIVNDIYKKYISSDKSPKTYVYMSYAASILVVVVGIIFGFMTESITSVLDWILAGLFGGYVAPNVLKWYWWRFNGYGYFAGMLTGMLAAMLLPRIYPDSSALMSFPYIFALSLAISIIVSYLSPAQDMNTLKGFYKQVRPWGFWGAVKKEVIAECPEFKPNMDFKRDMLNVVVGIIWQLSFTLIPIYLLIKNYSMTLVFVIVAIVTSIILKLNWYDKLKEN
jgi:Na+/proline symporter